METTEKDTRSWPDTPRHEYTRRGTGNAALTLGIIGTAGAGLLALSALGRGGGMFGASPYIASAGASPYAVSAPVQPQSQGPTAFEVYEKECAQALALTNELWTMKATTMAAMSDARQTDQQEKFSLWKGQVDADFALYKSQRDGMDALSARLARLETEVAVGSAVRPYQDRLLQCEIQARYTDALNYTNQRTCRAIYGEVVLPSTPVVTGYGSYSACSATASANTSANTSAASA